LFKHYWVINNFNHLYTNAGINYDQSRIETTEKHLLPNGEIKDFALGGFGNKINYQLQDAYLGFEYKFRIGKWTNKVGLYTHWYALRTDQSNGSTALNKTVFQPQWNSDYEFNKSESLNFTYKRDVTFPDANQLSNRNTLSYYNAVYKGNALLQNVLYQSINLHYSKMNMYRGITWNGMLNYSKKERTIRNEIKLEDINQYNTPLLSAIPETNLGINGSFSKKIYRFNLKLNTSLSWFNYAQTINEITTISDRNSQNIGLTFRTAYKKWPDLSIGYTKGYSAFLGETRSHFQTAAIEASYEMTFLKHWTYLIEYENLKNTNGNQTNFYEIANTSLRYQKKNSAFGFELTVNNLFDIQKKNQYSFSAYMISSQSQYILPRVILLSVTYKL
jgi:hypothetical protein